MTFPELLPPSRVWINHVSPKVVNEVIVAYRPIGPVEFALVEKAEFKRWPPRLPEQPYFYPVTNEIYARQIAAGWNVRDHGCGYVTRFRVKKSFLDRYPIRCVGSTIHTEWWIPAQDLDALNEALVGKIEVIDEFHLE